MISPPKKDNGHKSSVDQSISVVVLTYNSSKHIKKCLESILKQIHDKSEIIVIDNNSDDETVKVLSSIKKIIVKTNKKNVGFAAGVNKGIRLARNNYILLLNPDTVLKNGAVKEILKCLDAMKADIAGGIAYRVDGSIHGSYVRKPNILTLLFDYTNLRKLVLGDIVHKHHYYLDEKYPSKPSPVDVVSGAFMLIRKDVFKKIGYFDERFFMYLEDVDFCVRAIDKGLKVVLCPKSKISHIGGASSKNSDRIRHSAWNGSRIEYTKKHFSQMTNILMKPIFNLDERITQIWRAVK